VTNDQGELITEGRRTTPVIARWTTQIGKKQRRMGYACRKLHKEYWEPGWGRAYTGRPVADKYEKSWRSRSWPVKPPKKKKE